MKSRSTLLAIALMIMILCGWGCGRKETAVDTAKPLEQSFKTADPSVPQAVNRAATDLKAGNYAEATRTLAPVVSGRPLAALQKQAVGLALGKSINSSRPIPGWTARKRTS